VKDSPRALENDSVTLAEGMHFAGRIDGFSIDIDAEESVGTKSATTSANF